MLIFFEAYKREKIIWVKAEPNKNVHKKRYVENKRQYVTDQKTDRQTWTKIWTSTDRHTESHTHADTRIQRQIERKRDKKRNILRNGDGKTKRLSRSSDKIRLSMFQQSWVWEWYHFMLLYFRFLASVAACFEGSMFLNLVFQSNYPSFI